MLFRQALTEEQQRRRAEEHVYEKFGMSIARLSELSGQSELELCQTMCQHGKR